ncbi:MAG: large subunit ribosomal protein L23 [Chlamydiales bacterium]|jgi:large subunit ribosomal protein L23
MSSRDRFYSIIKSPVITEKGSDDTASRNAYHFKVPTDANKIEIRQAVETLFDVHVGKVNTLNVRGKARRRGWVAGRRPDWKKAMVTLREGDVIDVL